jgi:hypothetical protein
METHNELIEVVRRGQRVADWLRRATERLEEARRERVWAMVEAD